MKIFARGIGAASWLCILVLIGILLAGCRAPGRTGSELVIGADSPAEDQRLPHACTITEPAWLTHPEDSAVDGEPAPGFYYVNANGTIWASAWWYGNEEFPLRADGEGFKVGWFRPAGAELEIEGRRMDGEAPPLEAHVPCCYPTRFQASGLLFPTEGCWEIRARAADQMLEFIVQVDP